MFSSQRVRFNEMSCLKYACPCPKDIKPYFQVDGRKPGSQQKGLKLDLLSSCPSLRPPPGGGLPVHRHLQHRRPRLAKQTDHSKAGSRGEGLEICVKHIISKPSPPPKPWPNKPFPQRTSFQVSTKIAVSSTSIHLVDFDASSVLLTSWNFWTSPD